jgi:streptogramin lyase
LLIVATVAGFYAYQQLNPAPSCSIPLGNAKILRTHLSAPKTFGAVTEYALPQPSRDPNAPTVAPDGSVWFGEQTVPGVAHFFPGNGTLVEYQWPFNYPESSNTSGGCSDKTSVWGVAFWNGKVWASDTTGNQLVAMDPSNGQVITVKLQSSFAFPYTLVPGPGNNLWFPESFVSKLGVLSVNGTVHELSLPDGINQIPSDLFFENSTTGYYSDAQSSGNGGVYSFDTTIFSPTLVGSQKLNIPSSATVASGALWVALHGSSNVASYNFTTKSWSYYPTSYVDWNVTSLPYFVKANGSSIWFNEHLGNKMARIDPANDSLTEYSLFDKAVNGSTIGNTLTFALGGGRAWFTEWTGNKIGYVDSSYRPGFSTAIQGNTTVTLQRGSSATVNLLVKGVSKSGTLFRYADTESMISRPSNITFFVSSTSPGANGDVVANVKISASQTLKPGTYFAMMGVSDGLTFKSSFLKIVVRQ